jgi:hypothetical protein
VKWIAYAYDEDASGRLYAGLKAFDPPRVLFGELGVLLCYGQAILEVMEEEKAGAPAEHMRLVVEQFRGLAPV